MWMCKQYGGLLNSNKFESDFIKNMMISMDRARPEQEQIIGEYFIS